MMKRINSFTAWVLILPLILSSCVCYRPNTSEQMPFLSRVVEKSQKDVSVSIVALGDEESKNFFGTKLFRKGIQPIWIQIKNNSPETYIFSQCSVDAHYYSANEAAYIAHYSALKRTLGLGVFAFVFFPVLLAIPVELVMVNIANRKMDSFFAEKGVEKSVIQPGETVSGFVFTHIKQGVREVHLKLYGEKDILDFNFFVEVPGFEFDYEQKHFDTFYSADQIIDCTDKTQLRKELETLPKKTTDKKGKKTGDPLNLVIIGTMKDLLIDFVGAGWDQTEAMGAGSALRMAEAFVLDTANANSPISPLYVWGRSQDISFQKARDNVNERMHLRLWLAPIKFQGTPVWVGGVSRDIGVRFTMKTWNLMTHKIDANLDDARDYVLVDFIENNLVKRYGFLEVMAPIEKDKPGRNLTGDPYYVDGFWAVIELGACKNNDPSSFGWDPLFTDNASGVSDKKAA